MALEIELKFLDQDLQAVRDRLAELGARPGPRLFEANTVYDDAQGTLRGRRILLRLRRAGGAAVLTVKLPPEGATPGDVKVFEELETRVENPEAMDLILSCLGYAPAFQYEKVREEWELCGCHVCLDRLPFGNFVEIEGGREELLACADQLGLDRTRASTRNYHSLHQEHRRARGLPPEDSFVFGPEERERLVRSCPPGRASEGDPGGKEG